LNQFNRFLCSGWYSLKQGEKKEVIVMRPVPEEKKELARAMLKAKKTYREVAAALELSIGSVHNIMAEGHTDTGPLVEEIKKHFSSKYYMLVDHILDSINMYDIGGATLKEKAIAAAILTDKAMLVEGKTGPEGEEKEQGALEHLNSKKTPKGVEKKRKKDNSGPDT
jgi:hypothetical protein